MNVAIVGVTGMVGTEMLKVLAERKFPVTELFPVASEGSIGMEVNFLGRKFAVITLEELLKKKVDIALFSAGAEIAKQWAPRLSEKGCKVIDNSSYWRMVDNYRLIVPEINGNEITKEDQIIANPNCSTIQLVMALAPLHQRYQVKRVVVSTYQSVTGTGKKAVEQLENEEKRGQSSEMAYHYPIYHNVLPHCDLFEANGYTKEEMKLTNETKKILDKNIDVVATAVRVPVIGGHSESVNICFEQEFDIEEIRSLLSKTPGIKVVDNLETNEYPMPINAHNKDEVFVGRLRRDFTQPKTLNMWIVADNLRKGAATNAVQIAELLLHKNLLNDNQS